MTENPYLPAIALELATSSRLGTVSCHLSRAILASLDKPRVCIWAKRLCRDRRCRCRCFWTGIRCLSGGPSNTSVAWMPFHQHMPELLPQLSDVAFFWPSWARMVNWGTWQFVCSHPPLPQTLPSKFDCTCEVWFYLAMAQL